jgi:hypothetical protein
MKACGGQAAKESNSRYHHAGATDGGLASQTYGCAGRCRDVAGELPPTVMTNAGVALKL